MPWLGLFVWFLYMLFHNWFLQCLKGLKNIKQALLDQFSGIFVEKAKYDHKDASNMIYSSS